MDKTYIENSAAANGKEAVMRLYGVIGKKVDGDAFAQELASLDGLGLDQINIHGNTLGGDVVQGMSIVSAILSMRTPVVFHVDGIVASMGAIIAVACDRVVMMDFARLMIHDPFFMGQGADKLTLKQKKMLANCTEMLQVVLSRRGKSQEDVADLMKAETWFSAQEAKAAGLCDQIVSSTKTDLVNMAPLQLVAVVEAEYESKINTQMEKITLSAEAAVALGLQNSAQDPQDVSAAIVKMKSDHTTELAKVTAELADFKKKQKEAQDAEAAALVDAAIKEGKISADMKQDYLDLCGTNFAQTKKILAGLPGKTKLGAQAGKTGNSAK
jgi:ATP-dependent protease ClpP protease subunit